MSKFARKLKEFDVPVPVTVAASLAGGYGAMKMAQRIRDKTKSIK